MDKKEKRLELLRRSCLNCGHPHWNHDPCCDTSFCVSDLQRENEKLKREIVELALFYEKRSNIREYISIDDYDSFGVRLSYFLPARKVLQKYHSTAKSNFKEKGE